MTFVLAFGSAVLYVAATYVMKYWDSLGLLTAGLLVFAILSVAVALEVEALRMARLGYVYILILGIECALAALCAALLLRESYASHEVAGLALIAIGIAVVHLPFAPGIAQGMEQGTEQPVPVRAERSQGPSWPDTGPPDTRPTDWGPR